MRVAFGSDEHAVLTEAVLADLLDLGHQVLVVADGEPWRDVARGVAGTVAAGEADRGVLCCRNATAVTVEANRVAGVRAALCTHVEAVREARRADDANVLALGLLLTAPAVAREMVAVFLATGADERGREKFDRLG